MRSLIGPNGAGKSTLFNVITGKLPASSGAVFYRGRDITGSPPHKLMKLGICRTFQVTSIFQDSTVFENVRVARQARKGHYFGIFSAQEKLKDVNEETWNILERIGLAEKASLRAGAVSHGDQRLLEFGIALAGDPEVLLLDEPTSGMSHGETTRTTRLIRRMADDIAVVLVEHDMDVVMSISDKISVLHQGRIIAEGTATEVRNDKLVREAYLGNEG